MTQNKARKREVRRIASAMGVSYTQANFIAKEFAAKDGPDQPPRDSGVPRQAQHAIRLRAQYTGEPLRAAQAGLGNDGTLGLDTCTPEQRKLRSTLAFALFNRDVNNAPGVADWRLHTSLGATTTMSPQHNRLVVLTGLPSEVAEWFLESAGLGFRLEEFRSGETYVCRHLPTGAQLVIATDAEWERREPQPCPHDFAGVDVPLGAETSRVIMVPSPRPDAERLLAGLFSRTGDPSSKWALGNWSDDPLNPALPVRDRFQSRSLSGHADTWRLDTNGGVPYIDDVAYSLTAEPIGIPGATCRDDGDHIVVQLGSATLEIVGLRRQPRTASGSPTQPAAAEQGGGR